MKHRGKILEKAVRTSKVPITKLAIEFKVSQRHMYNLFETTDISNEDMLRYGKIIGVDFSKDIPELLEYTSLKESQGEYKTQRDYMQLYFNLLEKHVATIEELNALKSKTTAPSEPAAPKVRQKRKAK